MIMSSAETATAVPLPAATGTLDVAGAPAPVAPPGLYFGRVMHRRLQPVRHRFDYRVVSVLLDVDRLVETAADLSLFSLDRFNLFSFHRRDHGPRDGSPLRPWISQKMAEAGVADDGGPVRMLCFPRMLGYVFNPITLYYCHARDGRLTAMLYEVANTFGGRHTYPLAVDPAAAPGRPVTHGCAKAFYVSPFIGMTSDYRFRTDRPGDRVNFLIRQSVPDGECLIATLTAERRPLTDRWLARAAATRPLATWKVIAGIHFEALRLWRKGAPFHPRRPHQGPDVPPGTLPRDPRPLARPSK